MKTFSFSILNASLSTMAEWAGMPRTICSIELSSFRRQSSVFKTANQTLLKGMIDTLHLKTRLPLNIGRVSVNI